MIRVHQRRCSAHVSDQHRYRSCPWPAVAHAKYNDACAWVLIARQLRMHMPWCTSPDAETPAPLGGGFISYRNHSQLCPECPAPCPRPPFSWVYPLSFFPSPVARLWLQSPLAQAPAWVPRARMLPGCSGAQARAPLQRRSSLITPLTPAYRGPRAVWPCSGIPPNANQDS